MVQELMVRALCPECGSYKGHGQDYVVGRLYKAIDKNFERGDRIRKILTVGDYTAMPLEILGNDYSRLWIV